MNAISAVIPSECRYVFLATLYTSAGNQRRIRAFNSISHPTIGITINQSPVNLKCRLKKRKETRNVNNERTRTSDSLDTIFLTSFCHFPGERIAGMHIAAIKMASPISSKDGVINMA